MHVQFRLNIKLNFIIASCQIILNLFFSLQWNLRSSFSRTSRVLRAHPCGWSWEKTCAWTCSSLSWCVCLDSWVFTLGGCPSPPPFLTIPPRPSLRKKEMRALLSPVPWIMLATSRKVACYTHASLSSSFPPIPSFRNTFIPGLLLLTLISALNKLRYFLQEPHLCVLDISFLHF